MARPPAPRGGETSNATHPRAAPAQHARAMAATFGGYGLPLNGALPAALAGGPAYSLEEANTRPPDASSDAVVTALALTAKPPAEEVLIEAGLVKARARGQEGAAGALHARRAGCVRAHLRCALMRAGDRRPHLVRR